MAEVKICPVCNKEIGFSGRKPQPGVYTHPGCEAKFLQDPEIYGKFLQDPEIYGGKAIKKTKVQIKAKKEHKEHQKEIKDKSVYIKDLDIPIKSMVIFMVKWALASIPAFIILALIGAIFFAIFGALFF